MSTKPIQFVVLSPDEILSSQVVLRLLEPSCPSIYSFTAPGAFQRTLLVDGVEREVELVPAPSAVGARDLAIRAAQGFVVVFSVHSEATFALLKYDLAKIFSASSDINVPLMVVGVSVPGMHREVDVEDAKDLARSVGAGYIECNPESSFGVLFALTDLIRRVPERKRSSTVGLKRKGTTGKRLARSLQGLFSSW